MAVHIVKEANRCLGCKVPQCQKGCPVSTPIPEVIKLFKDKKIMEAGEMLFTNNPMSAMCSIVCNHEKQCAGHCVLGRKGSPVHFSSIETYISETYLERMKVERATPNGKKVAVIGAGPAGMTCAIKLAEKGYDVTIFEQKNKVGGITQYGIPEFRLHKGLIQIYRDRLEDLGIHIRLNTVIGSVLLIDDLFKDGYGAVFAGTGAWRPRRLGIEGECHGNVHFAIEYLANPLEHYLGKTVAVIGMGNAAMDVARTALRSGAERVQLFSRDNSIAASSNEVEYAELDGAEFVFGQCISRITDEGPVFHKSILDENGQVIGEEDEDIFVQADSTIIAISQVPRHRLIRTTEGLEGEEGQRLDVDENYMTTREGVFAAGDVVTGSKTVVHAVEGAKKAAEAIDRYLSAK